MVRVLVLYPATDNARFDFDYYLNVHLKLVKERLDPVEMGVDRGITGGARPSPYLAVTHMIFRSREELAEKFANHGAELTADKEKFTDIQIITQVSEIIDNRSY